ncbi:TetR family transcriptional regulator [Pseudomonas sp. LP_7_YM]|uniref:TetR family transcriptional regulator n=1 Tax=Pseudomonas sp. LP_7_YM TaxID=2485137 RepID=UPI00105EB6F6|nr:TetR family transcriptional regulator [Pseudomonas sp. LP_7_YM]TDV72603.1 TetR family transcriptional regulator [Pseudomonas sp. LP_7_YM]
MKSPAQPEAGKLNTLKRILAAARQAFSEHGLAGARIDDIAHDAGVTKQLIHHYYGTKEGLFVAVLDEASDQIMSELVALDVDSLSPTQAMRQVLNHFFDQYRDDPLMGSLALEGIRYHDAHQTPRNHFLELAPRLIDKLDALLKRGAETGEFKHGLDAPLFLATAALVTTGWFTNRYSTSALTGLATYSEEGLHVWREHSVDFVLASIAATARS